jgi:hypothetical protein
MLLKLARFPWAFPDTQKIQKMYARSVDWLNLATNLLNQPRCVVPDVVACIVAAKDAKVRVFLCFPPLVFYRTGTCCPQIAVDQCPALAQLIDIKNTCAKWYNAVVETFATNRLQAAASGDGVGDPLASPQHARKSAVKAGPMPTVIQLLTAVSARMAAVDQDADATIDGVLTDCRRFCICGQTHVDGVLMIACDHCDNWFEN